MHGPQHNNYTHQDAEDIIDDVTALLEGDKSKDVRSAVVLALPLTPHTLPVLLDRARDVSPVVRAAWPLGQRAGLCPPAAVLAGDSLHADWQRPQ